ncbi:MAG TPA: hypothetical protein VFY32_07740 [Solirubrobacteraceae bacterium]|nr:hypothetical protein [Solirubrobacteraceae bacterium]
MAALLLSFVVGGSTMAIDIAGTSTAPVHVLDLHDWENEFRAPPYSTLGELVEAWIGRGLSATTAATPSWERRPVAAPRLIESIDNVLTA